jgi:hypothetical protein
MMYEYRITRVTATNNVESEKRLNEFGADGYKVVAWAPFNMDVVLILAKEVAKTSGKRQVTVEAPKE